MAIGEGARAEESYTYAIGQKAVASAEDTVAFGNNASATVTGGTALGSGSIADTDKGKPGYDPSTGEASDNSDATWKSTAAAVSVGGAAGDETLTRQITNVAAGTEDTDAVNVAQLKAVAAGSAKVKVINGEHTEVTKGKDGDFVTYAVNVMTDGKVASGDSGIVTGDTVYRETRVEKDGNYIKKDNTAAENITALDEKVKDNSTRIDNINNQFGDLDRHMQKGIAGAAALAALHPMDFDPDDKMQFAAGVGNYRGETAAAIGAFYRPNEKVMFSIGGTFGNSDNLINAGITFGLDGNRNRIPLSRNAMAHEIVELKQQVARQDEQITKQNEQIARQDEQIAKQDEQIAKLTELVNKLAGAEQQKPGVDPGKAATK